ncbi:GTP-binding protein [Sediminitomix flava]|uniref:Tetracycline resistance protein TetQ n=1 Tax=Sediminitomix flava TaxID=379075 RepID=A0A315Z8I6_SEDFL|nr:TetM/TetW/TetO/TetS family tetracycline resistance ribosomal protection protein [Sediminitomix flava]PWJ41811.1 ribosomal protection tetracycline resistance protein [Sediminitomix flava]
MSKNIRNIGILAHVDAGKTTLTENFLYHSGAVKQLGSVDQGTAKTDSLAIEKERGISVKAAFTSFEWKNTQINLIDTPGHIDFSSEVERTIRALDGAILLVSAVEGIQAHTETIWEALKAQKIPTLIWINKIDRAGADIDKVLADIEKELKVPFISLHDCDGEGDKDVVLKLCPKDDTYIESLANIDDLIMEKYLEGEAISENELENALKKGISETAILPVMLGSAKLSLGIEELLDAVINYLPSPQIENKGFSALVYAVHHDDRGKVANVKIFDGQLKNRDVVYNATQGLEEKVHQMKKNVAGKTSDIQELGAGDIAAVYGLSEVKVGDILGESNAEIPKEVKLQAPLLTIQVKPKAEKDLASLVQAMNVLAAEDPNLEFDWLAEEREVHIKIMGKIQIEILEQMLLDRFNLEVSFEDPIVIYKETPSGVGEGYERYTMPKPCWAVCRFLIEPLERGSGVQYESKVGVNDILIRYQQEVERTIPLALSQGIKGWEVTDVKITLIEGEDHVMHSRAGDFVTCTPMGIMKGLDEIGTTLLEPILSFKIVAPEELLGTISSDIIQMRGSFGSPEIIDGKFILEGTYPVATSLDYPVTLSSKSGGKAKLSTKFHSYQACEDDLGVIREFKGISPLDRSKYILKARNALQ